MMAELKLKMAIARFPYGGNGGMANEHPSIGDWLYDMANWAAGESRVELLHPRNWRLSDTPITMTRNRAAKRALENGVDVLVMCDSDQIPDLYVGADSRAKPFVQSSFDFLYSQYDRGPCIILAPYCGPQTGALDDFRSCVYVFKWAGTSNSWDANNILKLEMLEREEALLWKGFGECAAGATGMIMIDTRVFSVAPKPYFAYEWNDEECAEKASTEDVYFTRNASLRGIPVYCNWDAWAGHVKPLISGKPKLWTIDEVRLKFNETIAKNISPDMEIRDINVGKSMEEIERALDIKPSNDATKSLKARLEMQQELTHRAFDLPPTEEGTTLYNGGEESAKALIHIEDGNGRPAYFGWCERPYGWDMAMRILDKDKDGWGFNTSDEDLHTINHLFETLGDKMAGERMPDVLEIGSWVGQTTRAIADGLFMGAQGGFVTAVDTWEGSDSDHLGQYAKMYGYEKLFGRFLEHTMPYVAERNVLVTPIRTRSEQFAEECKRRYDGVFIDGDHSEGAVSKDIINLMRLIRPGGLIAGHDYDEELFPAVVRVVSELLPDHQHKGRVWWAWVEGGSAEADAIIAKEEVVA
jgi:hypothetical protein